MSEDVYKGLREFMDKLPGGYPATDTGVELKILKKLFSPDDAELVMHLKFEAEEVPVITQRLGVDESAAVQKLEDLASRGLIFRVRAGDRTKYQAYQFVVGIYEFQLDRIDRELAELIEQYLPYLGAGLISLKTKQVRVVPVGSAVDADTTVAPYNQVRDLVKDRDLISVSPCICRKEQGLLGHACDRPHETCIQFGDMARFYIDNGMARQIDSGEALKLLDLAEESSLVLCPSNAKELEWICCCCKCCCGVLRGLRMFPEPAEYVHSYYRAEIDRETCSVCGLCLDRCQIDAIEEVDEAMAVNSGRCIGCGLCLPACPEEAISFVSRPGVDAPPTDLAEMLRRVASERGVS